jgi:hypothetical protein
MRKIRLGFDNYSTNFDILDINGKKLGKYQIYSTGSWEGSSKIRLNICAADDEPFEKDSLSCVEFDMFDLIKRL